MHKNNAIETLKQIGRFVASINLSKKNIEQTPDNQEASSYFSIIVPVFDAPHVTERCLSSLEEYADKSQVIVVDDCSVLDETKQILEKYSSKNKDWIVIHNKKQRGHSRTCEIGVGFAEKPYICLLNSDAIVTPYTWAPIKYAFDSDQRIAAVGPTTSHSSTEQKMRKAEICRLYWNNQQIFHFAKKIFERHNYNNIVDLKELGGFAFTIRMNVWQKMGGFDKNLPDYGNETELCVRLRKNYRLVWAKKSYIHHVAGQSYSKVYDDINKKRIAARNYIRNLHRDLS